MSVWIYMNPFFFLFSKQFLKACNRKFIEIFITYKSESYFLTYLVEITNLNKS